MAPMVRAVSCYPHVFCLEIECFGISLEQHLIKLPYPQYVLMCWLNSN